MHFNAPLWYVTATFPGLFSLGVINKQCVHGRPLEGAHWDKNPINDYNQFGCKSYEIKPSRIFIDISFY